MNHINLILQFVADDGLNMNILRPIVDNFKPLPENNTLDNAELQRREMWNISN